MRSFLPLIVKGHREYIIKNLCQIRRQPLSEWVLTCLKLAQYLSLKTNWVLIFVKATNFWVQGLIFMPFLNLKLQSSILANFELQWLYLHFKFQECYLSQSSILKERWFLQKPKFPPYRISLCQNVRPDIKLFSHKDVFWKWISTLLK